jgi:hypothetical protein
MKKVSWVETTGKNQGESKCYYNNIKQFCQDHARSPYKAFFPKSPLATCFNTFNTLFPVFTK